jgi:hypothetical protein
MLLICKLTGHEMWMEEYPPGPVVSVCIRCGYREIRMPQIPEPVHGAEGGHGDFHCGFFSFTESKQQTPSPQAERSLRPGKRLTEEPSK